MNRLSINGQLGLKRVFDNEIAVQKRCGQMQIECRFAGGDETEAAKNFWEAEVKVENVNRKEQSGYKSDIKERTE